MAFSSGEAQKGRSSRRPKSGSGVSRKLLFVTAALGSCTVAAIWLVATAATVHSVAKSASPHEKPKPSLALVQRAPVPTDPRVLVVPRSQPAAPAELSAEAITAHWNRKNGIEPVEPAAQAKTAELPAAVDVASFGSFGKPIRPTWQELNAAKQAGRLDILRRAMAATGTDEGRTQRLAFAAPSDADAIRVVATLGNPLPAPEASIEVAFVGDLLGKTGDTAALAEAESDTDGIITGAVPPSTEMASLENPFEEVLAPSTPDVEDAPIPAKRPPRAALPEPEATIPMRAKREPAPKEAPKTLLAYARPENPLDTDDSPSIFGKRSTLPGRASRIAVYDITAGVVHMPNGEKLKASSGRGEYRDNPKFVHLRNRGSTPPNVYHLRMREARFHGIEAIRMTPVNQKMMFGRDGMLTHTYLLRRRGDSSGCVVFADYNRFLNAFKRGEVKTLVVVPRLSELPKYMAML